MFRQLLRKTFHVIFAIALVNTLVIGSEPNKSIAAGLKIIESDKALTTIIVPQKAGKPLLFAAGELQRYFAKMSNTRVEYTQNEQAINTNTRIYLFDIKLIDDLTKKKFFDSSIPDAGTDEFSIQVKGNNVIIGGGSERAVLFAVYDLLERMGCRWFGPNEEFVPEQKTVYIPKIDIHEKPSLRWRFIENTAACDSATVDWMAKAKLNGAWPITYQPNKDMTFSEESFKLAAVPAMIERGMIVIWGEHILPILVSPETYKDHPEYFAEIKGKRLDPNVPQQTCWQLCTSNPEVMRILTENTVKFLSNHSWIDILVLWANDTQDWCECRACRALEPDPDRKSDFGGLDRSASYARLLKTVIEGVRKVYPDKRIMFNHYYNLEDPPVDKQGNVLTALLPPDNAIISVVDCYRQCDRHAFADANCPRGKRIEPVASKWSPYYKDPVYNSYYFTWNFMKGLPVSEVHKIPADFQFAKSLGINGMVDCTTLVPSTYGPPHDMRVSSKTDHTRYNILNFYIYGKASWNVNLDVDAVADDFINHYYGPAAEPMKKFWALLEDSWTKFGSQPDFMPEDKKLADSKTLHGWPLNIRYVIPNRNVFDKLEENLRQARHLAASAYDQPLKSEYMPYLERVQLLERALATWPSTKTDTSGGHL